MIDQFERLISHIRIQYKYMLIFALLFSAIPQIPNVYYRYFDTTNYYEVSLPLPVDKTEYHAGEYVEVRIKRIARESFGARAIVKLLLIDKETGNTTIVDQGSREMVVNKTMGDEPETMVTHWFIPEKDREGHLVKSGAYYFVGIVQYELRGVKKIANIYTVEFNVIGSEVKI